jgi:WD40 repeat protein
MRKLMMVTISIMMVFVILISYLHAQNDQMPADDVIYINAVAWSHDGSKIAVVGIQQSGAKGYIRVVDVATGKTIYEVYPEPGGFTSVAWSVDDRFIAVGGYDQTVWVFDVVNGVHIASLFGHKSTVTGVDWNADGTRLVSSGN